MTEPPPVQRPLQVRVQEVLANIQAAPQAPLPVSPAPQDLQVALAAGNQNPGLPEPPLQVSFGFVFSCSLSLLPLRIF